jgi:hypothetical protein
LNPTFASLNRRSSLRKLGAGNSENQRNPAPTLEIMGAGNLG